MTTRERILAIRLLEGNRKNPEFFKEIKVDSFMRKENVNAANSKKVEENK